MRTKLSNSLWNDLLQLNFLQTRNNFPVFTCSIRVEYFPAGPDDVDLPLFYIFPDKQWRSQPANFAMLCKYFCVFRL